MLPPIERLNSMTDDEAAGTFELLFERAPRFFRRVLAERPYASYEELIERARLLAENLPVDEQQEVIDGHPRIGASPTTVSTLSYREQGFHRRPAPEDEELAQRLDRLNSEYERRFGFRCVVFVAGRPRSEIAEVMERQLAAPVEEERRRCLSDVFLIARSRLAKLAQSP